jgi:hypothetical protein
MIAVHSPSFVAELTILAEATDPHAALVANENVNVDLGQALRDGYPTWLTHARHRTHLGKRVYPCSGVM